MRMLYTLPRSYSNAGVQVNIPDEWIKTKRAETGSTKIAIDKWLFENGYMQPDEYEAEKAATEEKVEKDKPSTRRRRQPDETKRALISLLYSSLLDSDAENVEVTNVERVIAFTIGEDKYEVILSKKRKTK